MGPVFAQVLIDAVAVERFFSPSQSMPAEADALQPAFSARQGAQSIWAG